MKKTVVLGMLFLLSTFNAFAHNSWEKVLECGLNEFNGKKSYSSAVIDVSYRGREGNKYQLVLRNDGLSLAGDLSNAKALFPHRWNGREVIIPLIVNPNARTEFVGEDDAFQSYGVVYYVKHHDGGLVLEAFRTSLMTNGIYKERTKLISLYLNYCRF